MDKFPIEIGDFREITDKNYIFELKKKGKNRRLWGKGVNFEF